MGVSLGSVTWEMVTHPNNPASNYPPWHEVNIHNTVLLHIIIEIVLYCAWAERLNYWGMGGAVPVVDTVPLLVLYD